MYKQSKSYYYWPSFQGLTPFMQMLHFNCIIKIVLEICTEKKSPHTHLLLPF